MTVSAQTPISRSAGNGVTTVFPYTFKIISDGDIEVSVDDVVKTLNVDYTVSGAGLDAGGDVTMTTAPAVGTTVVRRRDMAIVRSTDYQDQGTLPAATLDLDIDSTVLMMQQLDERLGRTFSLPASSAADGTMPAPVGGYVLGWDALGKNLTNLPASTGTSLIDLAAPTGSSLVGFIQSGTGAVTSSVQNELRAHGSRPENFGAIGNGSANDATAIGLAITSVIAAGGGVVWLTPGKVYNCTTRIGTFISANNVVICGYGATIKNSAGSNVNGLLQFGDASVNGSNLFTASATTVNQLKILGLKFTSSNVFNVGIPGRWSDQLPISINTAKDVLIRDCYFENWDFAAVDFGARCVDCLVDACSFYSSQVEAGHANYGVRIFCYSTYSYINADLSPTDTATGILKAGYTLPPETGNFGHENISVTNCYFEHVSHGVMVSAARRGIIASNRFVNCSTRSVSLTTFSKDYLCSNNTHSLDTNQQTSAGVSVFYGIGQATYGHKIQGDKFTVIGATNNATGFSPIKCYINSHKWLIAGCTFEIPDWAASGGRCVNVEDNSDGVIRNNTFNCHNVEHPISVIPGNTVTAPGFQQAKIWILGNIFENFSTGAIQVFNTTSSPEPIVIKDNIVHSSPTRFIAVVATDAGKVPRLLLKGNQFIGSPVRYVDNITANKAILLEKDVLELESFLSTGGGVTNPSSTSVSFDFSSYHLPACFTSGQKRYLFSAYGDRANAQQSTDFYFSITGETATSISGDIIRNAGASFQVGQVALKVIFEPLVV